MNSKSGRKAIPTETKPSQETPLSVAGDHPKCRRSEKKFGPATLFCPCGRFLLQVTPKTQTCDVLPPDQQRFTTPPATVAPLHGSGAMIRTFRADFVRFIAQLVNESHVFGVFCAVRCPPQAERSNGVQTCSRPRLYFEVGANWLIHR